MFACTSSGASSFKLALLPVLLPLFSYIKHHVFQRVLFHVSQHVFLGVTTHAVCTAERIGLTYVSSRNDLNVLRQYKDPKRSISLSCLQSVSKYSFMEV